MADQPKFIDPNARVLVLSTSLNPKSNSRVMARRAHGQLVAQGTEAVLIDLQDLELPFCGTPGAKKDYPDVGKLYDAVEACTHILFAMPIYNWDVSAAAKNVVELMTDNHLIGKTIGFMCAAGGGGSYMAVMGFANSLMLDFRSWVVPRFVYATRAHFEDGKITSDAILERIDQLINEMFSRVPAQPVSDEVAA